MFGEKPRGIETDSWIEELPGGGVLVGKTTAFGFEEAARWFWGDGAQDRIVDMYGTFLDEEAGLSLGFGRLDRAEQAGRRWLQSWIKDLELIISNWYDEGRFDYLLMEEMEEGS